jgi:hypothetical protein
MVMNKKQLKKSLARIEVEMKCTLDVFKDYLEEKSQMMYPLVHQDFSKVNDMISILFDDVGESCNLGILERDKGRLILMKRLAKIDVEMNLILNMFEKKLKIDVSLSEYTLIYQDLSKLNKKILELLQDVCDNKLF